MGSVPLTTSLLFLDGGLQLWLRLRLCSHDSLIAVRSLSVIKDLRRPDTDWFPGGKTICDFFPPARSSVSLAEIRVLRRSWLGRLGPW